MALSILNFTTKKLVLEELLVVELVVDELLIDELLLVELLLLVVLLLLVLVELVVVPWLFNRCLPSDHPNRPGRDVRFSLRAHSCSFDSAHPQQCF